MANGINAYTRTTGRMIAELTDRLFAQPGMAEKFEEWRKTYDPNKYGVHSGVAGPCADSNSAVMAAAGLCGNVVA